MDPATMLAVGTGVSKLVWGGIQQLHANSLQKNNIRPTYQIPKEQYQELGSAEQRAQEGLPEDVLSRMHDQAMRGLSESLSVGQQTGASANSTNDYYQSYLDKLGSIGINSSMVKFQNENNLNQARENMINQKFIQFGYNQDAPFKDRAQLATQEKTQGVNNMFGGLDQVAAGFIGQQNRDLYQKQIDANNKTLTPVASLGTNAGGNNALGLSYSNNSVPIAEKALGTSGNQYYWNKLLNPGHFGLINGTD